MSIEHLQPVIRLSIANPESKESSLFGPGIATLCQGVQATGSLNAAAKEMGMAYSKAWRIVKDTEQSLGVELLVRDGAHGSTLTEECLQLLDIYQRLLDDLQEKSDQMYQTLCSEHSRLK